MPTILKPTLHTIGYSGCELQHFLDTLVDHGIDILIDIREIPISRKRGFSKTALSTALVARGIEYVHMAVLGSPKALRHEVRDTQDYRTFFTGVKRHLRSSDSRAALDKVVTIATNRRACLMCFCSDWNWCHRKCVVEILGERSPLRFEHLTLPSPAAKPHRKAA